MAEEHPVRIRQWLYPVSFLYGMGVNLRNKLFDWKILSSTVYSIPVICVGNITVGGTGKTPHTEYLIRLLREEFHVAVLSRGYKRKTKGYVWADSQSSAHSIGDEPYQIKKKFPEIAVAVDGNRCRGIEKLYSLRKPRVDVILLDDALQHRYVQAGLTILLTDYYNLYSDDVLLPAGRLREPMSGKDRASMVIVTKCPQHITPIEYNIIVKKLGLYVYQDLYFSTLEYGSLMPVFPDADVHAGGERGLESLAEDEDVLLITGIASPERIQEELERYTSHVSVLAFADHHEFSKEDIDLIEQRFLDLKGEKRIVITTEKDAARLVPHDTQMNDEIKKRMYALPIEVSFLKEQQDTFNKQIIDYVRKNKRDSIFSERRNRRDDGYHTGYGAWEPGGRNDRQT